MEIDPYSYGETVKINREPVSETTEPQKEAAGEENFRPRRSVNPESETVRNAVPVKVSAVTECVRILKEIDTEIANAKKTLINSETCIVNREYIRGQLNYLKNNLPGALDKANEIVENEQTIRHEVETKKEEILSLANAKASSTVGEAMAQAKKLMENVTVEANALAERAQNDAMACIEAAKAEAARIIEDAQKKANQLVEEQAIVRRAKVESEELMERSQNEAATLKKNTLDYMDNLLADADRNISELVNSIRLERSEIQSRR